MTQTKKQFIKDLKALLREERYDIKRDIKELEDRREDWDLQDHGEYIDLNAREDIMGYVIDCLINDALED
jgi:hypothetical protein